jgi:hypothetical protein
VSIDFRTFSLYRVLVNDRPQRSEPVTNLVEVAHPPEHRHKCAGKDANDVTDSG